MSSSDSTNLVLGILGVLTIIPIILGFIKNRLPSARLRYFDELLAETDSFLLSLEEQGLFRKPSTATYYRECLAKVRQEAERPRWETYCATSLWQQLKGLFNGLSKDLSGLSSSALKLRAKISTTATEDLAQAAAEARSAATAHLQGAQAVLNALDFADYSRVPPSDYDAGSNSSIETLTGTPHISCELPTVRPFTATHTPHLGDAPLVVRNTREQHQSEQYVRRKKRYLATHHLSMPSVAQMEYRKSGVMHSVDFKRALRTRTYDSVLSGSTCVSEPDSLPVHVKPTGDHRHSGLRRVLGFLRHRSRDEASDTRLSYRRN